MVTPIYIKGSEGLGFIRMTEHRKIDARFGGFRFYMTETSYMYRV